MSSKAYIIRAINWSYNDEFYSDAEPGATVCAFRSRDKAEAHRRRLEAKARAGDSPFDYGDCWEDLTERSDEEIAQHLSAHGIPYPEESEAQDWERGDWYGWWEENVGGWSPAQQQAAWDAFEQVRFYEVVEIDLGDA